MHTILIHKLRGIQNGTITQHNASNEHMAFIHCHFNMHESECIDEIRCDSGVTYSDR